MGERIAFGCCWARSLNWLSSAQVMKLGEARTGDEGGVSALGFSPAGNLLGVGHANGDVAFWELKRTGWECVKAVKGCRP